MGISDMTIPQQLKDLIKAQFEDKSIDVLFVAWGEGTWSIHLDKGAVELRDCYEAALTQSTKEAVELSGYYETDDWRIEEEEM